jgi:hypothetical protein
MKRTHIHGLHLNGLGKELLFSNVLHIYSALEKDTGPVVALTWRNDHSQVISETVISDNQELITNDIILNKLNSTSRLAKDRLASCVINGNMNMGNSRMMKTRTSNRTKKSSSYKKRFFMVKSSSMLTSNFAISGNGPNYLNYMLAKEQISHAQLGKSSPLLNKESSKTPSKVALQIYHQNIQGLRGKIDEIVNFLQADFPHILCLSEHHLNQLELETVRLGNYTLGASYCRRAMKMGDVCIYVHPDLSFSKIDLSSYSIDQHFEVSAIFFIKFL